MTKQVNIREQMRSQIAGKELFEQAKSFAYAYMDEVNDRNVFPNQQAIHGLGIFDEP